MLGSKALSIGHLNSFPDVDGAVRTEPLVVGYYNQYYPSLSLLLAVRSLNEPKDIHVDLGEGVQLGNQKITTDQTVQMHTHFYKDMRTNSSALRALPTQARPKPAWC